MSESNQPSNKGTFVLFKNIKKEGDHPRKPVYSGSIELPDGTKFDLAGWINEGKVGSKIEGQKYIKGEVKEPWVPAPRVESATATQPAPAPSVSEDDIPW